MKLPFLDFFKKKTAPVPAAAPARPPLEKPESERFSKTVLPNATRTVAPQDPFAAAALTNRPVAPSAAASRPSGLPPAVALALEPRVERTISLYLSDVVSKMPPGRVRPLEGSDVRRVVLLKAAEVERGMASGRPTISLGTVYQQVPEIFLAGASAQDETQVELPLQKVLEQFSRLTVRADQSQEQVVPQMETPFLQVTLEDDKRFGTVTRQATTPPGELPVVRLEPATAETIAAAEPEASGKAVAVPQATPIRLSVPSADAGHGNGAGNGHLSPPPVGERPEPIRMEPLPPNPAAPARIPFNLSPNGTGEPAPERVPASSGPSVPTGGPVRIPFKLAPVATPEPPAPLAPAAPPAASSEEPWLTKENVGHARTPGAENRMVALALGPVLRNVLPLQLTRELGEMPEEARIEVPFTLLEGQLASGRIEIDPRQFAQLLPPAYRDIFNPEASAAAVLLPLQEVLKNLPATSLQIRHDQVEEDQGEEFETPFSTKAREDAQRLNVPAGPVAKQSAPEADEPTAPAATPAAAPDPAPLAQADAPAPAPARTPLQEIFATDEPLDPKAVVARLVKMPGIRGCTIMFGDGLSLAGTLPEELNAEGLCVTAPSLVQRLQNLLVETKLGALQSITLACAEASVTFFMSDALCLAALHEKEKLAPEIHATLARVLLELSSHYSHRA